MNMTTFEAKQSSNAYEETREQVVESAKNEEENLKDAINQEKLRNQFNYLFNKIINDKTGDMGYSNNDMVGFWREDGDRQYELEVKTIDANKKFMKLHRTWPSKVTRLPNVSDITIILDDKGNFVCEGLDREDGQKTEVTYGKEDIKSMINVMEMEYEEQKSYQNSKKNKKG